ncbi:MAG: Nif11-like leader peptide family natural product precursor [Leptolyngbyaceae cyanobacterium bins.349]|nr:Nif11-like leader peptide family natural product precursor [Leptolyngbyaceae cyanobacterium bins.349]
MAREAVAQLFRAAQVDSTLRDELNQAPTVEQFIQQAKRYGYEFTLEEWQSMTSFSVEELAGELSEIPGL